MQILGSYVLDASVIVKWFSEEEFTEIALKFRSKFIDRGIEIIEPDLLLYEIANALRYNKNFYKSDVEEAIKSLVDMEISILVPSTKVMNLGAELAYKYNITFYDAFYIALAKTLNILFVTADNRLYEKVKELEFVKLLKEFGKG